MSLIVIFSIGFVIGLLINIVTDKRKESEEYRVDKILSNDRSYTLCVQNYDQIVQLKKKISDIEVEMERRRFAEK